MLTKLTPEQEATFPEYVRKWTAIGLSTGPIDREKHDQAIADVYALAKLEAPRMIYTPCPMSGALAAAIYTGWLDTQRKPKDSAVRSAVDSAVRSAVRSAVHSAVRSAVRSAVDSAVRSAVRSAVHSAVRSAVDSAVYSAVRSAVDSAVDSAVHSAVRSAVDSAVGSAVYSAVHSAVRSAVYSGQSIKPRYPYWLYGNQWAGYAAWGEFFRKQCAIDVNDACLAMMEHGHLIWPFEKVCFASERPIAIHTDDQGRSHCEDGPAVEYQSGWGPHCWHGTVIPPEWIQDKPPTAAEALKWDNMEQRRAACEIVGWVNILDDLNAKTIDKHANPMVGELVSVDIPDVGRERFLRVKCGTNRLFALPVPPDMDTAENAQRWLNFVPDDVDFIPAVRT